MEITKDYLENLYNKNSNEEAAKTLGVSIPTLLKMIKKNGIPKKRKGNYSPKNKIQVVG